MNSKKIKRLRIFAGPNGSGKTTIIKDIPKEVKLGYYINADDIESELKEKGRIELSKYGIKSSSKKIQDFILHKGISNQKLTKKNIYKAFRITRNNIKVNALINSYIAADIAEFIRQNLLECKLSFSFETVLSHPSKIELIKTARKAGYRVYLYYVATETPEINISRIANRVAKEGHPVNDETVRKRYKRSLDLLLDVVKLTHSAYLFDNSGKYYELIAEVTNGKKVQILDIDKKVPEWFIQNFYLKIKRRKK